MNYQHSFIICQLWNSRQDISFQKTPMRICFPSISFPSLSTFLSSASQQGHIEPPDHSWVTLAYSHFLFSILKKLNIFLIERKLFHFPPMILLSSPFQIYSLGPYPCSTILKLIVSVSLIIIVINIYTYYFYMQIYTYIHAHILMDLLLSFVCI